MASSCIPFILLNIERNYYCLWLLAAILKQHLWKIRSDIIIASMGAQSAHLKYESALSFSFVTVVNLHFWRLQEELLSLEAVLNMHFWIVEVLLYYLQLYPYYTCKGWMRHYYYS